MNSFGLAVRGGEAGAQRGFLVGYARPLIAYADGVPAIEDGYHHSRRNEACTRFSISSRNTPSGMAPPCSRARAVRPGGEELDELRDTCLASVALGGRRQPARPGRGGASP